MKKIKTLLMIMIMGLVFISCEEYNKDPLVKAEEIELMYKADTVQYAIVTDNDNNVTYFRLENGKAIPEVTLIDKQTGFPIFFMVAIMIFVFMMGYTISDN